MIIAASYSQSAVASQSDMSSPRTMGSQRTPSAASPKTRPEDKSAEELTLSFKDVFIVFGALSLFVFSLLDGDKLIAAWYMPRNQFSRYEVAGNDTLHRLLGSPGVVHNKDVFHVEIERPGNETLTLDSSITWNIDGKSRAPCQRLVSALTQGSWRRA